MRTLRNLKIAVPGDNALEERSPSVSSGSSSDEEGDIVGELPSFPNSARGVKITPLEFPLEPPAIIEYETHLSKRVSGLKLELGSSSSNNASGHCTPTRKLLSELSAIPHSPSFLVSPRPKERASKLFSPGISRDEMIRKELRSPSHKSTSSTATTGSTAHTPKSSSTVMLNKMVFKEPLPGQTVERVDCAATRIGRIRDRIQLANSRGRSGSLGIKEDQVGSLEQLKEQRIKSSAATPVNSLTPFASSSTISSADMSSRDEHLAEQNKPVLTRNDASFRSLASQDVQYKIIGIQYEPLII